MSYQEKREIIRGNETDISGIKPVTGKQWRKGQQTSIFVNIIFVFIYGMFTGWNPGLKINHTYRWKYMVTHILAYILSQRKLVHSEIQMKGQNLLSLARLPLSSWARGRNIILFTIRLSVSRVLGCERETAAQPAKEAEELENDLWNK